MFHARRIFLKSRNSAIPIIRTGIDTDFGIAEIAARMERASSKATRKDAAPRLEPAKSVIEKLGGEEKVTAATGTAYTAPYRWQYPRERGGGGGQIPQKHHPVLLEYARSNNIKLSSDDFLPPDARERSRSSRRLANG